MVPTCATRIGVDPMNDLEGITVIALEQAVAAPYVSGRLAEAGARVIKIERAQGDFAQALRPASARPERLLRLAECWQRKCDAKPKRFEVTLRYFAICSVLRTCLSRT